MPLPPLTHQLSNFEQIEILRNEIEQFEEELKKTESRIRDALYQIEKQRFLTTVHPVFQNGPVSAETEALPEMHTTRETLANALEAMKGALTDLEAVSGPVAPRTAQRPAPMPPRAGGAFPPPSSPSHPQPGSPLPRKNRFDAF